MNINIRSAQRLYADNDQRQIQDRVFEIQYDIILRNIVCMDTCIQFILIIVNAIDKIKLICSSMHGCSKKVHMISDITYNL